MGAFDDIIKSYSGGSGATIPTSIAGPSGPSGPSLGMDPASSLSRLFQSIAQNKAQEVPPPNAFKPMPGVNPASPMIVDRWVAPYENPPFIPSSQGTSSPRLRRPSGTSGSSSSGGWGSWDGGGGPGKGDQNDSMPNFPNVNSGFGSWGATPAGSTPNVTSTISYNTNQ